MKKLAAQRLAQLGGFQAGGNDPVATQGQRPPRARQHQRLDVTGETEIAQIVLVQACQYCDRQNFGVLLDFHHGSEDVIVPMRGDEGDAETFDLGHRLFDRFRHVEKFNVSEDLLIPLAQPLDEIKEIAGHEKLQSHFVERDRVAQFRGRASSASSPLATSSATISRSEVNGH